MREDQQRFLMLRPNLPARLTVEQAAWILNCQVHDMPGLIAAKLLKPLGNPPANGVKFFAAVDIEELAKDRSFLARMSNAINQHWQKQNAAKKRRSLLGGENGADTEAESPIETMRQPSTKEAA